MKKMLNTLYLMTENSYVHLDNNAVIVHIGGDEKVRVPANTIDSIYCFGNITVSTPLIAFCGERGIGLVFLSPYGRFYGRIEGPVHGNVLLRQKQYALLYDEPSKSRIVKSVLLGKFINSREFLMRARREHDDKSGKLSKATERISSAALTLKESMNIDAMRGTEGIVAAEYFSVLPEILQSEKLVFKGRTRRPPEDPVNAVLSFLYTLLKNDMQSAIESIGMDPAVGYLHTVRPGRPALALDLMEELRVPLCDRLTVSLINKKQIDERHFESLTAPVMLTEEGRKIVVRAWQKRKTETIHHPFLRETVSIGLIPHIQALLFARVVRGELDEYPPFHWR